MRTSVDNFTQSPHFYRNEIIAGFTTFFTMAYIIAVNPLMLSNAGMDYGSVFVATCVSAAFGCFAMGFLANYPIALAPSMSLNAYFSFYIIQQLHYSWEAALGIVCVAGILFALLSFTQLRQWLAYAMPHSIKMALVSGIGLFLIVVATKSLDVHLTQGWASSKVWLCILGVLIVVALDRFKVIGAILLAMMIVTAVGYLLGLVHLNGIIAMPPSISPTLFKLVIPNLADLQTWIVILILLFVALFDNTGTLIAILGQAKLLPKERKDVKSIRLGRALFADSVASSVGSILGTSPIGSYIESAAGVRAGGRTGLTAIVVGILFLCALFFAPLAKAIPDYATATALIYVGMLMTRNLKALQWDDISEWLPAMICVVLIPYSFSIADGISGGFISYVLLKCVRGKVKELDLGIWIIAGLCIAYLVMKL